MPGKAKQTETMNTRLLITIEQTDQRKKGVRKVHGRQAKAGLDI